MPFSTARTKLTFASLIAIALLPCIPMSAQTKSIFHVVPTPNDNFNNGLQASSAFSPTDIWAVGQGTIHFDGTKWTVFPAPLIKGDNTSFLGGVGDISPTEAWAVGTVHIGEANPGQVIEHWDGTQWSQFPGPTFPVNDEPELMGLTAIAADDIWAVGSLLSNDFSQNNFLFEHWDGTAWTYTATPSNGFLLGIGSDSSTDAWAVGFQGAENDNSRTLTMHWNGTTWKHVNSPSVGVGANQLNAVLVLAPNNVWAVGFKTSAAPPTRAPTETLIEHFDGTSWSIVPSPNVGPNSVYQSNALRGITAVSPTDIWAFGSYFRASGSGNQMTLLLHWDGTSWTIAPSPNPTAGGGFLSDLLYSGVSPAPGNVWIFGSEDAAPHQASLAIHTIAGQVSE